MKKILLLVFVLFCAPVSATPLTLSDARHLLTRTGFGASPNEINQLLDLSREQAVDKIVSQLKSDPQTPMPAWTKNDAPNHWRFGELSDSDKQKYRIARSNEMQSLKLWWLREMISTPSPQTERLVLFWHNHFATAYSSINHQSISIARQHTVLRKYSSGNFREFLKQIIRDPGMLNYLDNNKSHKSKPNENLARELMELFSLGEGNYSEQDVKNAARALTGYSDISVYDQRFSFKHWIHDKGKKIIFGKRGKFNGDDLIDLILEQPEAARFITAKLWRVLIGDIDANDNQLTPHASVFRESDYEIKSLYKSILNSDEFWHADNRATIVQSPVSLVVGSIRSTGILPSDWQTLPSKLDQMGQQLFEPPNVAGWPGGGAWITPGRLLTRLEWLRTFADGASSPARPTTSIDMMATNDTGSMLSKPESNTMMQMSSAQRTIPLKVRLASEEFDGPVQYSVTLFGKDTLLWESGIKELIGGHDTARMGRINRRNMPWQTINFPLTIEPDDVEAIEIAFHNDKTAPPDADRNLFISRATFGDRVWLAHDGKQNTKCNRRKPAQQGNLYCAGNLRMEKQAEIDQTKPATLAKNKLRTSGVYLNSAQRPSKSGGNIAFTLSDVEYSGRFWKAVNVRYIRDKHGKYSMRMNNFDCWPECLTAWPDCAWTNDYDNITLSLELTPANEEQQCMYTELAATDKKFMQAMWTLTEDIYRAASDSKKLRRPKLKDRFDQWLPHIEKIGKTIEGSIYHQNMVTLKVVEKPIHDYTIGEEITEPLPAGITDAQRNQSLTQLQQKVNNISLSAFLLPTAPSTTTVADNPPLDKVITDLVYQLK